MKKYFEEILAGEKNPKSFLVKLREKLKEAERDGIVHLLEPDNK